MSGEVEPVLFYHVSTRRILECTIGFEAVTGVREVSHENLGLVEVRLDDLCENPAWRQQTRSSIPERYLMFLTIGQASSGRRRSGKHVGNTGNHSGKLLPVWCRHGELDRTRSCKHRTVERHREKSSCMCRQAERPSGEVGPVVFFDQLQTWRILTSGIGFEAVAGLREGVFRRIGTVGGSARRFGRKSSVAAINQK